MSYMKLQFLFYVLYILVLNIPVIGTFNESHLNTSKTILINYMPYSTDILINLNLYNTFYITLNCELVLCLTRINALL